MPSNASANTARPSERSPSRTGYETCDKGEVCPDLLRGDVRKFHLCGDLEDGVAGAPGSIRGPTNGERAAQGFFLPAYPDVGICAEWLAWYEGFVAACPVITSEYPAVAGAPYISEREGRDERRIVPTAEEEEGFSPIGADQCYLEGEVLPGKYLEQLPNTNQNRRSRHDDTRRR